MEKKDSILLDFLIIVFIIIFNLMILNLFYYIVFELGLKFDDKPLVILIVGILGCASIIMIFGGIYYFIDELIKYRYEKLTDKVIENINKMNEGLFKFYLDKYKESKGEK